jgi:hypothetical protein
MSNCTKLLSELLGCLEHEVDPGLRAEIEAHAARCPNCYVIIDSTRKSVQIFKDCGPYEVSAALHARIEQAVRLHVEKSSGKC